MPTIVYDDSAAAEFWEPIPEGMTPAEFQPNVLTREEVTKYVELPNPNPDDWNIPEEGITPEYIERVLGYIGALQSGIFRTSVAIGADDPRVLTSAGAPYSGSQIDGFVERLTGVAGTPEDQQREWASMANLEVLDFTHKTVTTQNYPCVFTHVTYDDVTAVGSVHRDYWIAIVRDSRVNALNPSGWRIATTAPGDAGDLSNFSCDAWDSDQ